MAAYPSISFTLRTEAIIDDSLEVVRADNGKPFAYSYGAGRRWVFAVEHNGVTRASRDSLLSFYDSNRTAGDVTFPWAGTTYTCLISRPPDVTSLGADLWRVVMHLAEQ